MDKVIGPDQTKLNDLIVSLDVETSGLDSQENDILEIAAIVAPLHPDKYAIDRFHCFLKHPEGIRWDESTKKFHEDNGYFEYQATKSIPWYTPGQFVEAFKNWVTRHQLYYKPNKDEPRELSKSITALGKNFASFDLQFLNNLPGANFKKYKFFRHRAIDIGNLLWNPLIDGTVLPASEVCIVRGEIGAAGSYKHRAMDDAEMMLDLLKKITRKWLFKNEQLS